MGALGADPPPLDPQPAVTGALFAAPAADSISVATVRTLVSQGNVSALKNLGTGVLPAMVELYRTASESDRAQIAAAQGHYREAADTLGGVNNPDPAVLKLRDTVVRLLRAAPAAAPLPLR